ncbi:hypothetical protein LCI18_008448 [Fusarium solani-melongenae]|uniref:Uncharacterized protein n=1 Tax=Fusarium solani subsp. cucurbitae TaxID=2747967 RepID=A0ACD3Z8W7_FUSSC|nr:hypothetical protein LCI18_008448 [Fusarium solani-melongenae]
MATPQQDQSEEPPLVLFAKDGKRPWIDEYGFEYKFRPADEVTTIHPTTRAQIGPYRISEAKDGKYSLCDREDRPLQDGRLFEESMLTPYDPFAS